jgi:hypothetical protein
MSIGQVILNQLGGNRFIAMTGAKNLMAHSDGLSLRFPQKKGKNFLKITLNDWDTYNLEWGIIRNKQGVPTYTKKKEMEDIYADSLQEIFTAETGLYTHL